MKVLPTKLRGLAAALATGTLLLAAACGGNDNTAAENTTPESGGSIYESEAYKKAMENADAGGAKAATAGLITKDDVKLSPTIDQAMVSKGKSISELKCLSCHSMGDNKVVGPGWKGITSRREPEWIMNMVVHTDAMLETDPAAQKMLEECLVRMPNQNLTQDEARQVLEYMRTLK
ncbi:cytochrome c [Hymenobacter koreensis]|uniref:Cytochrome c domain-containing protein n=1 Tax=Hymenobacter koreensis TaxID=1084523 RepID=A0ABP8J2D8_9BACT